MLRSVASTSIVTNVNPFLDFHMIACQYLLVSQKHFFKRADLDLKIGLDLDLDLDLKIAGFAHHWVHLVVWSEFSKSAELYIT